MQKTVMPPVSSGSRPIIRQINRFLTQPAYILTICLLTLLSSLFSWELPVYGAFLTIGIYICLFADDLLPLLPIATCSYISTSIANNPGSNPQTVYSQPGFLAILGLLAVGAICLIWRIATDKSFGGKKFFTAKPTLLPGMVILGVAYMLGGLASPAFPELTGKNILFGAVQLCVIALPYYILSAGVRWERCPKSYYAWLGFGSGLVILVQLLWAFHVNEAVVDGIILWQRVYTGWGMHNNVGCLLAMMIPFAFALGCHYRRGWIGMLFGGLFLVGVSMTTSRASCAAGLAIYLLSAFVMLRKIGNTKTNLLILGLIAATVLAGLLIFRQQLQQLFRFMLDRGLGMNNRDDIYEAGLKQFSRYPIFGGSFYPIDYVPYQWSTVESFSSFFPPRWHNTAVQLLACTGVVGLTAYIFHRCQTIRLFLKNRSRETAFMACSLLVLLGCSLLDCHFFNFGPVLYYSSMLAFAEHLPKDAP